MVIIGLTGSIGMGKTTAARMFRSLGVPVHDADAAVHALFASGGAAVPRIAAAFPGTVVDGRVDRQELGRRVLGDDEALRRLEGIVHPLVRRAERRFLAAAAARHEPVVVLDIPLLFETGGDARCDLVVVVSAPARVQRARVLSRPGMTADKLGAILNRQVPDVEKRRRADVVIPTGLGRRPTLAAIHAVVETARRMRGRHWPPRRRRERTAAVTVAKRQGES